MRRVRTNCRNAITPQLDLFSNNKIFVSIMSRNQSGVLPPNNSLHTIFLLERNDSVLRNMAQNFLMGCHLRNAAERREKAGCSEPDRAAMQCLRMLSMTASGLD